MQQWMQACHFGVATVVKENSTQSSVITQQGQNLKLKGCYLFLQIKKKIGVLSTIKFLRDLLPQRLNAVTALCVSLCLTSYTLTCRTMALVNKKDVLDCIEMNSLVRVDQLVEILRVRAWENDPSSRAAQECWSFLGGRQHVESWCQKINDIYWGLFWRCLETEWRIYHLIMPFEPKVQCIHIQMIGPILNICLCHGHICQYEAFKARQSRLMAWMCHGRLTTWEG